MNLNKRCKTVIEDVSFAVRLFYGTQRTDQGCAGCIWPLGSNTCRCTWEQQQQQQHHPFPFHNPAPTSHVYNSHESPHWLPAKPSGVGVDVECFLRWICDMESKSELCRCFNLAWVRWTDFTILNYKDGRTFDLCYCCLCHLDLNNIFTPHTTQDRAPSRCTSRDRAYGDHTHDDIQDNSTTSSSILLFSNSSTNSTWACKLTKMTVSH